MCECIDVYKSKLADSLQEQGVELIGGISFNTVFPMRNFEVLGERTVVEIQYVEKKTSKNGDVREVKRRTKVINDYCPFCGNKYE
ncbi:hypothetical protein E4T80_11915 [Muribacter muris]|uniref:Uncharacterized protein n=1 Tax=Muribacter muris TaxID=67855 RepID=A0A4Y9JPP9_9PAST|nr:hypothetical protein [Muribacter muris]MBF0786167.1 hypothetical protein [Muribacter muris]MBF0828302.1 hypothetical protein [Muribacter muris]TFV07691.1 hypothetical protein E4T80_11915 [Muribacter muris]